jgi:hypothetical protein
MAARFGEGGKSRKDLFYIAIILILAAGLSVYVAMDLTYFGSGNAMDKVVKVYELLSEGKVEVMKTTEESGLYRVVLRVTTANGDSLQEVYVSKDGSIITDKVIRTDDYQVRLEKEKAFADCLKEKKLLVFGQSNEQNTVNQLMILGNYGYKVYVDCTGANLQACQQLGITQIPTIALESKVYTGVHDLAWFEQTTGCNMSA